jgi:hypothetical protein
MPNLNYYVRYGEQQAIGPLHVFAGRGHQADRGGRLVAPDRISSIIA